MGQMTEETRAKRREYCRLWQRRNKYNIPDTGFEKKVCLGCGVVFTPRTSNQKFHNKACGTKYRAKTVYKHRYSVNFVSNSPRNYINALLSHKHRRDNLDIDYMMELYETQGGKCALSGRTMTYQRGNGKVPTNISIDRIDSSKGYVKGNVQLVCCLVNILKNEWDQEDFINFCRDIVKKADKEKGENNGR